MRRRLAACALALALAGCSTYDAGASYVATQGAAVADRELAASVWGTCYAATAGALRRYFGTDMRRAVAWSAFCTVPGMGEVIHGTPQ